MSLEGADFFPTPEVPDFYSLVQAATDDSLAIRSDGNRINPIRMSPEKVLLFSCVQFPHENRLICTTADHSSTIACYRYRVYRSPGYSKPKPKYMFQFHKICPV